uniref:Family with sequence similarity 155 member A n=1 Tax=Malurus cyaneus samueli TaxID=2593467 RepID=A0A8C5X1Y0_9PASS
MTRGAWMCSRQYDDGLKIWFAPRENEKPFTDSERAQKWRLSLASLLFFTVLLSDHLWFCAEAKFTGTGEKEQPPPEKPEPAEPELLAGMGEPAPPAPRLLAPFASLPRTNGTNGTEPRHGKAAFLGNSTARPLETCPPPGSSSGQCFSVGDAEAVCRQRGESGRQRGTGQSPEPGWDLTDFYLSFCNSYTLWELFAGLSNPDTLNCSLDVVLKGEGSCSQCVQAYQRYDQHAQEKYEEFEVMLQKYLQSDEYSVKSCPEDCKVGAPAVCPVPGCVALDFPLLMNMRLAPARLPASSGLGCDLAAGSDRVCMTMSGARSRHRVGDARRRCPGRPSGAGGRVPGDGRFVPAAARGAHRRLRVGSVGRWAPGPAVLKREMRLWAGSGSGTVSSGALWSWGKVENKGVCRRAPQWPLVGK